MRVPLRITPLARSDIRAGEVFFDTQQTGLGARFVDVVLDTLNQIADMPLAFGEVDDGVRAVGTQRFGYVVYYRTDGTEVEVLAVLHGGRPPSIWQGRV